MSQPISAMRSSRRHALLVVAVFAFGVLLRLVLWSGYGLGDDPGYFQQYYSILRSGTYDPNHPYSVRFGIWVPVVLCMKLLGVTEAGFVGVITLCSFLNLLLAYGIARQEWGAEGGLLAMALLAVFPLDVLCSTLFANDILLATYCFGAFWLFRESLSERIRPGLRLVCAAGTGFLLLCGFVAKPWVMFIGPLLVCEGLSKLRRRWSSVAVAAGSTAVLIGAFTAWQWSRFGDPLHHITIAKPVGIFLPYSRDILLDNPRMLFLRNEYGSYFAGFYPHALVLLMVLLGHRLFAAGKWLAYFAIYLVGLSALPSHRVNGAWVTLVPHIFRYLTLASIPLCLALTAYVREVIRKWPPLGGGLVGLLLLLGVVQSFPLTWPSRDAFGEERRAMAVLQGFPDERVYSDADLIERYRYFWGGKRVIEFRSETPEARARDFGAVGEGVVVTGGGRLPWYGCYPCTAWLDHYEPPPSWTLVTTFEGAPITQYRREPLRVWRVSETRLRVAGLLAARTDEKTRRALVSELFAQGDYQAAAEAGQRLLADAVPDAQLAYWTGKACQQVGKPLCAGRELAEALRLGLGGAQERDALGTLVQQSASAGDFATARKWLRTLRDRSPGPVDPAFEEAASDMAEGFTLYHQLRYSEALRLFTGIVSRADERPDVRRHAQYFRSLTLFRLSRVREAVGERDAYRAQYGEDGDWVELLYREAEALRSTDPATARAVFTRLSKQYPGTIWGREAERNLARLGGS